MASLYHPVHIGPLALPGNLFLAPVAGYSDRAFRSICADCGADFAYTEMVSGEALTRGSGKTEELMRRAPNEKAYAVQIFGGKPETMAGAARIVLEKTTCECIDINCGCPVPKIIKTGAGSALTREPEKLYAVVKAVVDAANSYDGARPQGSPDYKVPVTAKIRSGWDSEHITWREAALAAIEAGVSAITLHARTRAQGYEGKADWKLLAELVQLAAGRIPVFGSGDAFTPEDAARMLSETGCDGVMFARGAMGNPFLFTQTHDYLTTGAVRDISGAERIRAGFRELALLIEDRGEKSACMEMRKRFCAYSKGISGGGVLRKQIVAASTQAEFEEIFAPYTNLKLVNSAL
ncbi:MAG: tRNA dihydrouridine synthase DusB [Treponema sp.]|nr:tRNA dihydrouridine synthase DusB [Treponema sp.]